MTHSEFMATLLPALADLYCPVRRYQLPSEPAPRSAAAAAALAAIDARESDAELRADLMSNALLVPLLGECHAQPCFCSSELPPA